MIDVVEVDYDSRKKWATVRGRCDPCVLVKCIKKMGKIAVVVSYCKDPTSSVGDKSCHAKGKEKASSASRDNDDDGDDDVDGGVKDGLDQSKEKKQQRHYMRGDYVPLPKVDESVCRDEFCPIHRIGSANMAAAAGMNGSMYWHHPVGTRMGAFRPPPPPCYGQFGMPPPPPHPCGYHPPPPPGYGFCPDQVESTASFFREENPAGGCNTM